MKKLIMAITIFAGLIIGGCEKTTTEYVEIDRVPAAPQGVESITADEAVYLFWLPVRESDLEGYRVYRSLDDVDYFLIGHTSEEAYVDHDVVNGQTYYYAVSAYDRKNHESELSHETVFDTPRPEGQNLLLADYNVYPQISGYDFSTYLIVPYSNINADFYIEYFSSSGVFYINMANDQTDIQDMGYTADFDVISYAPSGGWSAVGWSELIAGHTYVIWTKDDHYAKLRVTSINAPSSVHFDWGYQTAVSNPELARPQHDANYLRRSVTMSIIK